jgi:hypothetical protein
MFSQKSVWCMFMALLTIAPVRADRQDSNGNLWTGYIGDHAWGESPWGLHLEAQLRWSDLGQEDQQFLFRPGINYRLNEKTAFSLGYAYIETQPYGDFPAIHEFPEHRFWQQVTHQTSWLGLQWTHRIRLEQRWIGEMAQETSGRWEVENWRYENRLRYMLRTTLPLVPSKDTYLFCSNETFFNFGKNVDGNDFDQNRAFIGIGHRFNPTTRLEVGYMEQTIQRRGGSIWEHNHTLVCWLMSSHPF